MENKTGDYMITYTGLKFYPLSPDVSMFCLEDVARALSHENRANGHTSYPMNVAQHSVNVSIVLKMLGFGVRTQFIGLCHDISEAYIKDIPTVLKEWLPDYRAIEDKVQAVAFEWAGLGEVTDEEYEHVHWVDRAIFPVEARTFMPNTSYPIDPMVENFKIFPQSPSRSREEFIKLFKELRGKL